MARFASLATLNVGDALPDAWVDEVKVHHDWVTQAGANLASAASIVVTAMFHRVTGTTTITTITDSSGPMSGQELFLYFVNGPISIGTSGNISTLTGGTSTYVAGDIGHFVYDSTSAKWVENVGGAPADLNQTGTQVFAGNVSTGPPNNTLSGSQTTGVYVGNNGQIVALNSIAFTAIRVGLTADTQERFNVNYLGSLQWGPGGSTVQDTSLVRASAKILQVTNKLLEGFSSTSAANPGTWTPDVSLGLFQRRNVTSGGASTLTIAAPSNMPAGPTGLLFFRIVNTAGGTITLSWNGVYVGGTTALPASIASGAVSDQLFAFDATGGQWILIAVNSA